MVLWCLCGVLPGLWLEIRLEMLSLMVSTLSSLVSGSKLDWKCCPLWFPPRGFCPMVSSPWCLCGVLPGLWLEIRLEMCLRYISPKWHYGMVSFSSRKQQTITLKSCDHSFQPIRRLHSVKSHTSLEKLWDFMQKEFPFKEQSCETALLKMSIVGLEPKISCVRDRDDTTRPQRHK